MKMKKSIVQVCKAWYIAGLPFLYQDLTITTPDAVVTLGLNFARAPELTALAMRIILACHVPESWNVLFIINLAGLFEKCPNVHTFWDAMDMQHGLVDAFTIHIPPQLTNITCLHLSDALCKGTKVALLRQTAPNLITLAMKTFPTFLENNLSISFPKLQSLQRIEMSFIQFLGTLPSLTTLDTVLDKSSTGTFRELNPLAQQLQYLSIDQVRPHTASLQTFLLTCPNITHLTLDACDIVAFQDPLKHPRVEWIDLWLPLFPGYRASHPKYSPDTPSALDLWRECQTVLTTDEFPALKRSRAICVWLKDLCNLPRILPPDSVYGPKDGYSFQGGGFHLKVGFRAIHVVWSPLLPGDADDFDDVGADPNALLGDENIDDPDWEPTDSEESEVDWESSESWGSDLEEEQADEEISPIPWT